MPDAVNGQTDFGAGIYRGREAPENAVYDAVNCLIDDEGQPFRRGGSAYRSTVDAGSTLLGLADAYTAAGRRTLMWGPAGTDVYVLDAYHAPQVIPRYSDGTGIPADNPLAPARRVTAVGGFLILPAKPTAGSLNAGAFIYAGSLKAARYTGGGTVATTEGSPTVTGTGTSFSGNIDAGMIFRGGGGADPGAGMVIPVASVQSNTQLTLSQPATATITGASVGFHIKVPAGISEAVYWASAANRVIWTTANRAYFSDPFHLFSSVGFIFPVPTGYPDQYHELPADAVIFGADSIRDTAVLFTATGVWAISQMDFDPIDDMGNIQHRVEQINKDLILWGDAGISAYAGALVVPGLEDIVLLDASGGIQSVSQGLRPLYRSYVKAGYQPGVAVVHRGHYFLPVLNGTTLVDVLVCRLDRNAVWTRWSGHAGSTSYAQRVGEPSRAPLLLGISGQRVTDLSDCMDPSDRNASEADGSTHPMTVETRDYVTPGRRTGSTTETLRVRYEATANAPLTVSAEFSRFAPVAPAAPPIPPVPSPWNTTVDTVSGSHIPTSPTAAPPFVDGVAITTSTRVLLRGQSDPARNGIYRQMGPSGFGRVEDADTWDELVGKRALVLGGSSAGQIAVSDAVAGGTLNTTPVNWPLGPPPAPPPPPPPAPPAVSTYEPLTRIVGGAGSNGQDESVWRVGKRAPAIRFRITSSSAMTSFKLRSLEAPWRRAT